MRVVCPPVRFAGLWVVDESIVVNTLRCPSCDHNHDVVRGSAKRESRVEARALRSAGEPWKGEIPREQPVCRGLTLCVQARDSREGQSPEVGVRRTGSRIRPREIASG